MKRLYLKYVCAVTALAVATAPWAVADPISKNEPVAESTLPDFLDVEGVSTLSAAEMEEMRGEYLAVLRQVILGLPTVYRELMKIGSTEWFARQYVQGKLTAAGEREIMRAYDAAVAKARSSLAAQQYTTWKRNLDAAIKAGDARRVDQILRQPFGR